MAVLALFAAIQSPLYPLAVLLATGGFWPVFLGWRRVFLERPLAGRRL